MGLIRVHVQWEHKFHAKMSLKQAYNLLIYFSNSQNKWIRIRTCCFPPPLNFKFICISSNVQYFNDEFITHRGFKIRLHQAFWLKVLQMSDSLKTWANAVSFLSGLKYIRIRFLKKMKWDLWNTWKITGNRDETFKLTNSLDFGDCVGNTHICFHKLYKLTQRHRIFP